MVNFLISLLPASLFIYGFHILFQEDHLLDWLGQHRREKWPEWATKPLFDCPICMSSFWGTAWFFVGLDPLFNTNHSITLWIPYVFCLCGLNVIINKLVSKERIIIDDDNN